MKLLPKVRGYTRGTITVDWVVLTAAVVGLGAAVLASVATGLMSVVDHSAGQMQVVETQRATHTLNDFHDR